MISQKPKVVHSVVVGIDAAILPVIWLFMEFHALGLVPVTRTPHGCRFLNDSLCVFVRGMILRQRRHYSSRCDSEECSMLEDLRKEVTALSEKVSELGRHL